MTRFTIQYFLSLPYSVQRRVIVDPTGDDYVHLTISQWPHCEAKGRGEQDARRALHCAMTEWCASRARERKPIPLPDGTLAASSFKPPSIARVASAVL